MTFSTLLLELDDIFELERDSLFEASRYTINASLRRLAVSSEISSMRYLLFGLSIFTIAASARTNVDYMPALISISITFSSFEGSLLTEMLCLKEDIGEVLTGYAKNF